MERIEFIEATTRLEQYYEKTYTKEQLHIMYEELKNIAVDRYKKAIVQIIRNQKYLPKISDILEVSNEIPKEVKEIEKTNCEKCKGTGYVLYKKKVNNSLYEYGALCDCGNAPEYNGKDYYIPHIENITKGG